jgi:hypothetical protein
MMIRPIFLVFCLAAVAAQPRRVVQLHPYPGRTGLTLVAFAADGFAIASDGAQLNADGTISEVQKVFPIGKTGAAILAGQVSTQDPVTRSVREEFNVSRIVELWLRAHPDASFDMAQRNLSALVLEAANRFFSQRKFGAEAGKYRFSLLFASYAAGQASLSGSRYFLPVAGGKMMRTEAISAPPSIGDIWTFGLVKTPQELLAGNSAALNRYKADPAISKFRSAAADQLSAQDLLSVFDVVLQATESPESRQFDPGKSVIAPPNRLATITANNGFSFGKK